MSTSEPPDRRRALYSDAFQQQVLDALGAITREQRQLRDLVEAGQRELADVKSFELETRRMSFEAVAGSETHFRRIAAEQVVDLTSRLTAAEAAVAALTRELAAQQHQERRWQRGLLTGVVVALALIVAALAVEAGIALYVTFIGG